MTDSETDNTEVPSTHMTLREFHTLLDPISTPDPAKLADRVEAAPLGVQEDSLEICSGKISGLGNVRVLRRMLQPVIVTFYSEKSELPLGILMPPSNEAQQKAILGIRNTPQEGPDGNKISEAEFFQFLQAGEDGENAMEDFIQKVWAAPLGEQCYGLRIDRLQDGAEDGRIVSFYDIPCMGLLADEPPFLFASIYPEQVDVYKAIFPRPENEWPILNVDHIGHA